MIEAQSWCELGFKSETKQGKTDNVNYEEKEEINYGDA